MDELSARVRVIGHPGNMEPACLAVDVTLPANIVREIRILSFCHIIDDVLDIVLPVFPLWIWVIEIHRAFQPRGVALRTHFRIFVAQLKFWAGPIGWSRV